MKKQTKPFGTAYVPPQAQVFQLRPETTLLTTSETDGSGVIAPGQEEIWNIPMDFGSIL